MHLNACPHCVQSGQESWSLLALKAFEPSSFIVWWFSFQLPELSLCWPLQVSQPTAGAL